MVEEEVCYHLDGGEEILSSTQFSLREKNVGEEKKKALKDSEEAAAASLTTFCSTHAIGRERLEQKKL